ncbi:MAG: hypothetical protein KM296_00085 [Brockia lithotrophica]|nr:hypothetical protein [Brockia lithotrophica]
MSFLVALSIGLSIFFFALWTRMSKFEAIDFTPYVLKVTKYIEEKEITKDLIGAAIGFLLMYIAFGFAMSLVGLVLGFVLSRFLVRPFLRMQTYSRMRREAIRDLLELVEFLHHGVASGQDIFTALKMAGQMLSGRIQREVKILVDEMESAGKDRREAFDNFAKRMNIPEAKLVADTIVYAWRYEGVRLVEVLKNLETSLSHMFETKDVIEAKTSEERGQILILFLSAPAISVMFSFIFPGANDFFFSPIGKIVALISAVMLLAGFGIAMYLISRLMDEN